MRGAIPSLPQYVFMAWDTLPLPYHTGESFLRSWQLLKQFLMAQKGSLPCSQQPSYPSHFVSLWILSKYWFSFLNSGRVITYNFTVSTAVVIWNWIRWWLFTIMCKALRRKRQLVRCWKIRLEGVGFERTPGPVALNDVVVSVRIPAQYLHINKAKFFLNFLITQYQSHFHVLNSIFTNEAFETESW